MPLLKRYGPVASFPLAAVLVIIGLFLFGPYAPITGDAAAKAARACRILWYSLAAAGVTTIAAWVALPRRQGTAPLETDTVWTFSASWATNITLVGALLTSAVGAIELPSSTFY